MANHLLFSHHERGKSRKKEPLKLQPSNYGANQEL